MNTIKELYDEHVKAGKQLPVRVAYDEGKYLDFYFFEKEHDLWCGLDEDGNSKNCHGTFKEWSLYKEPKKTRELWRWCYKTEKLLVGITVTKYITKQEIMDRCETYGYKFIGKDPNCLLPLIVEET